MKTLKIEIRMYIAELLLSLAFKIASNKCKEGNILKIKVIEYFENIKLKHENTR